LAHLLEVDELHTQFPTKDGLVRAVDGVSFHLDQGETLGIVGESGSGKSVTAMSIMSLLQPPGRIVKGSIRFKGQDLAKLSDRAMEEIRGAEIAMIFQDPMSSLNPVFRIGWQVAEPLRIHENANKRTAWDRGVDMLAKVGIPMPAVRAHDYPHQFSGGMRQRAMIAMGITTAPAVLIADEPTTALDVTIQAQILDLLRNVNKEFGTATMLITHNLGVVAGMCRRVQVMYAGRIVEAGLTREVFAHPKHPYTRALLRSIPRLDAVDHDALATIEGLPPDLTKLPPGCAFNPRCAYTFGRCTRETPMLLPIGEARQEAACFYTQEGRTLG
jgi:oligopeptide/dipeptide ABC transporter ATP-binding protein